MKTCNKCKKELNKKMFYKNDSRCKVCKSEYNKAYEQKKKRLNKYNYKW